MVYFELLKHAKNLYLTEVDEVKAADTFFPEFDKNQYEGQVLKEGEDQGLAFKIMKYQLK